MKGAKDLALVASPDYRRFIEDLRARVISARISAARAVNRDLILLYWDIGRAVVEKQRVLGWGESVIDRVSADLQEAFPATTGFSPRNLRDMKRFYLAYADEAIGDNLSPNWRGGQKRGMAKFGDRLSPNCSKEIPEHSQECHRLWQKYPGAIICSS